MLTCVARSGAGEHRRGGYRLASGWSVLCSATVYPWYLLWILPWAALCRQRAWLVLSALDPAELPAAALDVPLFPWYYLAIWAPFALLLITRTTMVYRLTVSYRGTDFAGWQRQPNAMTVQEVVEDALSQVVGLAVRVVGAGRTDAGVHARGQVAHLELERPFESRALVHGTNHHLATGVRVLAASPAKDGFHARKCALGKEYRYRASRRSVLSPLDELVTLRIPEVDVAALATATAALEGRHDFSAFALAGGAHSQPWRRIFAADWHEDGPLLELRVVGDGFLRGMVRSLVGTLLEVGRGKRSVGDFRALLEGRPRSEAGPTAPAHGLVLERVFYDPSW